MNSYFICVKEDRARMEESAAKVMAHLRDVAEGIFGYGLGELKDAGGAFHAAEDADSLEGVDRGGAEDAKGRGAEKNEGALWTWRGKELYRLSEARKKRPLPHRDDKVIAAWNGLMVAALPRGGRVLGRADLTDAARAALGFIRRERWDGRKLWRRPSPSRCRCC